MKRIAFAILLCLSISMQAQTVVNEAKQKAELAKKAAEEAAKKAEEARIAALKAEEAAKAAEEAAKAESNAKAVAKKTETKANEGLKAAQNKWEASNNERALKAMEVTAAPNPDAKYLEGAVPEVNGEVEWHLSVDVPGKSAEWIYNKLGQLFTDMTHAEGQMEQSRVALADEASHTLGVRFQEWMVFRNSTLSLDRTEANFTIIAKCEDGRADVKMGRINYVYEENRNGGQRYKAEEWITDKYGLNKSKSKLARLSGKFRRKTIDRKDYIFKEIKNTLLLED